MLEFFGCLIVVAIAAVAWLNFEMHIADLGPLYDEEYRRIGD